MEHSLRELLAGLASVDPAVRDGWAYAELAEGINDGRFAGDHDVIRAHAVASLTSPEVQARTFAPLALRWLVLAGDRDGAAFDAVAEWYLSERDCRGYDDALGWLHAVAHGADYLGTAAAVGLADASEVLGLLAQRCTTPGPAWVDQEGARVAHAVLQALAAGDDPAQSVRAFTAPITTALAAFEEQQAAQPSRPPAWLSNTYAALTALYIAAAECPSADAAPPTPCQTLTRTEVASLASRMTPWLFTSRRARPA